VELAQERQDEYPREFAGQQAAVSSGGLETWKKEGLWR